MRTSRRGWRSWAVSLCWYLTLIFWSPHYAHELLRRAYLSGLPLLPPALFGGLQTGLAGLTAVLSIAYLAYHWSLHRKGQPVSFQKIALLAVFLSATFYLYVFLDDFPNWLRGLVGVSLPPVLRNRLGLQP